MAWRTQTTGGSFRPPGRTRGRESLAAGGESAGGNAVTQRGEIFLGRGGRAGFGPGTIFGVSFVAQRSGLARARGVARRGRRALGGRVGELGVREREQLAQRAAERARDARALEVLGDEPVAAASRRLRLLHGGRSASTGSHFPARPAVTNGVRRNSRASIFVAVGPGGADQPPPRTLARGVAGDSYQGDAGCPKGT